MYEFTRIERINPTVKASNERVKNFKEISEQYTEEEAGTQASRCIQCGNPYCSSTGCPLSNNIPQWLKFVAEKNLELAFNISNETSPFSEILGRICPQGRLCEGACTLNDGHGAITIGSIEVAISERGFDQGLKPQFAEKLYNKKVAIIGSGPAGLSCATFLLRAGVKPVIFEKADKAGGLLTYGIPGFKLEKEAVDRRVNMLLEAGMEIQYNKEVGKNISFDELYEKHDAVFLGLGAMQSRTLDYKAYHTDNLFMALSFLTNIQRKQWEKTYDNKYNVKNKSVIVIGGGDTAMDCVRTSIREGAKSVTCVYRRDEANMPGSKKEVLSAKEEGVEFLYQASPKNLVANEKEEVIGVNFIKTELIEQENGRAKMQEIEDSEFTLESDVIILALGFKNEKLAFLEQNGIKTNDWGGIVVNDSYETTKKNVFAGGDMVRGADLVVTAALDGREAAMAILENIFEEEMEHVS